MDDASNRPEAAPASPDPATTEEFSSFHFTPSIFDAASSLGAQNSRDLLHLTVQGRPDNSMEWTDDKHNKYLDSLEASFVQQLHQSRGLLAWCKEQSRGDKDLSQMLSTGVNKASEEFAILQDGGWNKIIFEQDQPLSYIAAVKIPCMHCQELAGEVSPPLSADLKDHNEFYSEEQHLKGKRTLCKDASDDPWYHKPGGSIKEGTGQNFVDDQCKESYHGTSSAKRMKKGQSLLVQH